MVQRKHVWLYKKHFHTEITDSYTLAMDEGSLQSFYPNSILRAHINATNKDQSTCNNSYKTKCILNVFHKLYIHGTFRKKEPTPDWITDYHTIFTVFCNSLNSVVIKFTDGQKQTYRTAKRSWHTSYDYGIVNSMR